MAKTATRKKTKTPIVAMIEFSRCRDIPFNRIRWCTATSALYEAMIGLADVRMQPTVSGLNKKAGGRRQPFDPNGPPAANSNGQGKKQERRKPSRRPAARPALSLNRRLRNPATRPRRTSRPARP